MNPKSEGGAAVVGLGSTITAAALIEVLSNVDTLYLAPE
jgi:ADP-dependent phosphofructokinase/glucokinase